MFVQVEYINYTTDLVDIDRWCDLPSEGVQKVIVNNGGKTCFANHSLYWLYKEDDHYVAGCGSVKYSDLPLNEVLFFEDGRQQNRKIEFIPDLMAKQIKLGWWNGKERLVNG